ncbi:hypothetical protein BALCAV_0220035 [Alkalihalobacillus alcalophilus ATCC 27647 = CGMCC 1.3604]|uniref:Uncharacterized protein n=1 Tax=Alkalihalobacillus alcalophilus ATCC 27647 = CGMCC 1.3604 TaxID=1218173 RepID=A0A094XAM9_ALKAL|nr:hypothetical protein BALCAV_0220035 [Alkalihalobacillus alcalophilus ATCC 27647 = CGMCC 1.3604]
MFNAVLFLGIAVFQLLLAFGKPLAEYSYGGRFTGVLPLPFRVASFVSSLFLVAFAFVYLQYTGFIFPGIDFPFFKWLIVGIVIFLFINTVGNLASQSKKEKFVMSPLSALACLAGVIILVLTW